MIHSQKTSSCSAAASASAAVAVAVTEMDVGFVDRAAVEMIFLRTISDILVSLIFMTGVYFQIHNFQIHSNMLA